MTKCFNCNSEVRFGQKFCGKCGTVLNQRNCPLCGHTSVEEDHFCSRCGSPLQLSSICKLCSSINRPGDKFCSNCGASLLSDFIKCRYCQAICSNNKKFCAYCGQPMDMDQKVGFSAIMPSSGIELLNNFPTGMEEFEGVKIHFVGRDMEKEILMDALIYVENMNDPQAILIEGEAGIGKTRMLYEFVKSAVDNNDNRFILFAQSQKINQTIPFSLISELFYMQLLSSQSDSPVQSAEELLWQMARVYKAADSHELSSSGQDRKEIYSPGDNSSTSIINDQVVEDAHFLGYLIGLHFPKSPYTKSIKEGSGRLRERAFKAFTNLLKKITKCKTLVLLIDDTHWADPHSVELLHYTIKLLKGSPVLILMTTEIGHSGEAEKKYQDANIPLKKIELESFSQSNIDQIINNILTNVKTKPNQLVDQISSRCDGNPFFAEEIIRRFIEKNVIIPGIKGKEWKVDTKLIGDQGLPDFLEKMIENQFSKVTDSKGETPFIGKKAMVAGTLFWQGILENLTNDPDDFQETEEKIKDKLENVLGQWDQFKINPVRLLTTTMSKDQSNWWDMVMGKTSENKVKRKYHLVLAQWLKDNIKGLTDSNPTILAIHYHLGGNLAQAFRFYKKSAVQAKHLSAHEEAIKYYQQVVNLLDNATGKDYADMANELIAEGINVRVADWQERVDIYMEIGEIYTSMGLTDNAIEILKKARESILKIERRIENEYILQDISQSRAQVAYRFAELYRQMGKFVDANICYNEALRHLENTQLSMLPIQVITGLGFVCQQMGDSKSAIEICQRGLEELNNIQCEKDDRTRAVANLNNILAKIYYDNNQLTQAENYFSNCQELWHNLGDEIGIARALDNRARIYRAKGNYSLARGLLIKSLKLKDKLGDIFGLAETSKELADILFKQGQYDEALDIISGVESYALDFNFFEILSQLYRIRAEIYLEQEDYEKSFSYSVRATKLAENGGSQHYIAASLKIMTVAMIYKYHENLDDKSYAKISEVFLKAEKVFLEIGNHLELAYLYKIFGQYMMNCEGKRREGVEYLQKAVDTFSENQIAEELEKIEEILAQ